MLISYGSLAAAFVADSVGTITGWVVDTEVVDGRWREGETQPHTDEAPVAGATVQLWGKPSDAWGDDIKERDVQLVATAVTDADGFVTLRPPPASKGEALSALLSVASRSLLVLEELDPAAFRDARRTLLQLRGTLRELYMSECIPY